MQNRERDDSEMLILRLPQCSRGQETGEYTDSCRGLPPPRPGHLPLPARSPAPSPPGHLPLPARSPAPLGVWRHSLVVSVLLLSLLPPEPSGLFSHTLMSVGGRTKRPEPTFKMALSQYEMSLLTPMKALGYR